MSKYIKITEENEELIKKYLSKSEIYNSGLEAFAAEEAVFRVGSKDLNQEDQLQVIAKYETALYAYLQNNELAMNYDQFDEILENIIEEIQK